jgi:hypothetical protein
MYLRLVENGTTGAGNGPPVDITSGVPIRRGTTNIALGQGFDEVTDEASILVEGVGTASAANSIAFVKIWGWFPDAFGSYKWFPLGTDPMGAGTDADRGKLNGAFAIGEVATTDDRVRFEERFRGFRDCSRLYAEYGALTNVTRVDITLTARG